MISPSLVEVRYLKSFAQLVNLLLGVPIKGRLADRDAEEAVGAAPELPIADQGRSLQIREFKVLRQLVPARTLV
jgi:hypothetical protein